MRSGRRIWLPGGNCGGWNQGFRITTAEVEVFRSPDQNQYLDRISLPRKSRGAILNSEAGATLDLWCAFCILSGWAAAERGLGMNPRICRCCGETIAERGNQLSRNPNVCASCSSMVDGMEEYPDEEAAPDRESLRQKSTSFKETAFLVHIFV